MPSWSTPLQGLMLIVRGVTFRTAIVVALVVGTILSVVNQGGVVLSGEVPMAAIIRVAINYLVPYVVSSVGYLAPFRVPR